MPTFPGIRAQYFAVIIRISYKSIMLGHKNDTHPLSPILFCYIYSSAPLLGPYLGLLSLLEKLISFSFSVIFIQVLKFWFPQKVIILSESAFKEMVNLKRGCEGGL